jgi:hypothetical protein
MNSFTSPIWADEPVASTGQNPSTELTLDSYKKNRLAKFQPKPQKT